MRTGSEPHFMVVTLLTSALTSACGAEPGWEEPSSDSPGVSVQLPSFLRDLRGYDDDPRFGAASTDLGLSVVPQIKGGSNRTLNFAYPGKAGLRGYGSFAGQQMVFRKSPMIDQYGIHAVRTAIYRTDDQGNHTNAWFHFMAKDLLGTVYATQISTWDWQSGDEESTDVPLGAYPMYFDLNPTHTFMDRAIGPVPGIVVPELARTVFLSTDAVAPTSGIADCVLYLFNHIDPEVSYLAYFHERFGMVEFVLTWEEPGTVTDESFWVRDELSPSFVPIDGFSLVEGSLDEPAPNETTESELAGHWVTRSSETDQDDTSFDISLDLTAIGGHYDATRGTHDVEGTLDHPQLGRYALFGRYSSGLRRVTVLSSGSDDSMFIRGEFEPNLEESALLRVFVQFDVYETGERIEARVELARSGGVL